MRRRRIRMRRRRRRRRRRLFFQVLFSDAVIFRGLKITAWSPGQRTPSSRCGVKECPRA
jgi:hypothetical protein